MPNVSRAHAGTRRYWLFFTAVLAACVVFIAGCGGEGPTVAGSGAGRVAEFVPAGAQVYFEISTDLESGQWKQAMDLASRFPAYLDLIDDAKDSLSSSNVDFNRDIRPLLGDSAAVAVPDVTQGADPPVLIALDLADGKDADVEDLIVRDPSNRATVREQDGVAIRRLGDVYVAVFDNALVFSSRLDTVVESIDVKRGGSDRSLAGSRKVSDALSGLPDEVLAQGYVDFAEIVTGVGAAQGPEVRRQLEAYGISADAGIAISFSAESDGLRMKAVASKVKNAPELGVYSPRFTGRVPADTVAYIGAYNLYEVGRVTLERLAEGNTATKDQIGQLRGALNLLGLPVDDLKNLTSGEFGAALLPPVSGSGVPGVVGLFSVQDGKEASKSLDNVRTMLGTFAGQDSQVPAFTRVALDNGVTGWQGKIDSSVSIVYGVDDDLAIVGSSVPAVRAVQSPASRLSDDDAFRAATDQMPSDIQSLLWLDVEDALRLAEAAAPGQLDTPTRENLRPIKNVAGWATAGERPTFEVFVTVR